MFQIHRLTGYGSMLKAEDWDALELEGYEFIILVHFDHYRGWVLVVCGLHGSHENAPVGAGILLEAR